MRVTATGTERESTSTNVYYDGYVVLKQKKTLQVQQLWIAVRAE